MRDAKYDMLSATDITNTCWDHIKPEAPSYMFKPWDKSLEKEYGQWCKINEIMPVNSVGIVTGRDSVAIRWSLEEMNRAARDFTFPENEHMDDDLVIPVLYSPFDTRYTYYSDSFITRRRQNVMRHILHGENMGLIFMRPGLVERRVFSF